MIDDSPLEIQSAYRCIKDQALLYLVDILLRSSLLTVLLYSIHGFTIKLCYNSANFDGSMWESGL